MLCWVARRLATSRSKGRSASGVDYWLYVVVNCKTKPDLSLIRDPASKLSPKEEVSVVRYMVHQQYWKKAAIQGKRNEVRVTSEYRKIRLSLLPLR
jgi:hypothetical protein